MIAAQPGIAADGRVGRCAPSPAPSECQYRWAAMKVGRSSRVLAAAVVMGLAPLVVGCDDDANANCSPDAPEAWCAYGVPGGRCGDSRWRAVCRDGGWRCEAFGGYPGGISVNQCSGFGPPQLADGGTG
jgi:hypothetical protein